MLLIQPVTGKDNLDFNTKKSAEKITGFSAVLYEDQIAYGYWNKNDLLVKAGFLQSPFLDSELNKLINAYKDIDDIKLCSASIPFLHIPKKFYSDKKLKAFFRDFYPIDQLKKRTPRKEAIQNNEIITAHYANEFLGVRNSNRTHHFSSCLFNFAKRSDSNMIAVFSGNTMHLIYAPDGELQFYNQFKCSSEKDFLYFLLLSYKELGLSTKDDAISLSGRITKRSAIANLLRQYFSINWLKINEEWIRSGEHPNHFYHDLYFSKSCGL